MDLHFDQRSRCRRTRNCHGQIPGLDRGKWSQAGNRRGPDCSYPELNGLVVLMLLLPLPLLPILLLSLLRRSLRLLLSLPLRLCLRPFRKLLLLRLLL
ncbi:Protein of unknown function [Pyronema omphalodes CBS 100304]|uniref:Uncharacterized protein n=1 Tax=Pyronema omphalodes (strain CBS 100304) TaxID=1076935 RepID=U4KU85_PYROM|nr:Protein of unknown function [Pyronema omphalodes CBS 100304]